MDNTNTTPPAAIAQTDWVDTADYVWDRTNPSMDRGRFDLVICNDDGVLEDDLTWETARRNLARDYDADEGAWIQAPDDDDADDADDEDDSEEEDDEG